VQGAKSASSDIYFSNQAVPQGLPPEAGDAPPAGAKPARQTISLALSNAAPDHLGQFNSWDRAKTARKFREDSFLTSAQGSS